MDVERDLTSIKRNFNNKNILTNRELEYLSMVALGYKNNVIAKCLFVTNSTVKKTLENIYRKLNAKDRANAIAVAFSHKILSAEVIHNHTKYYNFQTITLQEQI